MAAAVDFIKVLYLVNRTTNLRLEAGRRFYGENEDRGADPAQTVVTLSEILERGLKLDIPGRTCATGHRLEIELEIKFPTSPLKFSAECIVDATEVFQNKCDCVSVRFTRHDSRVWTDMLTQFRVRQNKVTELFDKLKGE